MKRRTALGVAGGLLAGTAGCLTDDDSATILGETLTVTTTTSIYDTGLIDALNVAFEDRYGVAVRTVNRGTGAALEAGRAGDTDLVIVHARSLEDSFLQDGYGVNRRDLMCNDFVIVGPAADPAGVSEFDQISSAMNAIATNKTTFISRGDQSGTHIKEQQLWDRTEIDPSGNWYREAGSGMGAVLNQANLEPAYTISDRATFLAHEGVSELEIQFEGPVGDGPAILANPYGIIAVDPAVHETVNYDLAMSYIGFLTSPDGQQIIEDHTVNGRQLFFPAAIAADPAFEQYVPDGWVSE